MMHQCDQLERGLPPIHSDSAFKIVLWHDAPLSRLVEPICWEVWEV